MPILKKSLSKARNSQGERISKCLSELRECFSEHFDQNWLLILLEDLPIDPNAVDEIREFLSNSFPAPYNQKKICEQLTVLENFICTLKRYLLPFLREKLGISGLLPNSIRDKEQLLMRRLIACTFPVNLIKLSDITTQFKKLLTIK